MEKVRLLVLSAVAAALTACSGAAEPELAIMGEATAELPGWLSDSEDIPVKDLTHVALLPDDFSGEIDDGWVPINENLAIEH